MGEYANNATWLADFQMYLSSKNRPTSLIWPDYITYTFATVSQVQKSHAMAHLFAYISSHT